MRFSSPELVCIDAIELVTDYLEGKLSRRDRRRFEKHLRGCPHCSAYLQQIRQAIATAGRIEPEELDPGARQDLLDLFRRYREND